MSFNHIIVQMHINDEILKWAQSTSPHLVHTKYSCKRNDYLLLSRSLLEYILRQYFNISKLPEIAYLEHGKPYFPSHPELSFNITHTNATMAIIVANKGPVGIDIETIKERKNFHGLEERILFPQERAWLKQQPNYLKAFFTLWSAKEAYLKATGAGLSGLSTLRLDFNNVTAHGPLINGNLYIDDTSVNESFVCYLPNNNIPNIYEFNGQQFIISSRAWQTVQCIHHCPKERSNIID